MSEIKRHVCDRCGKEVSHDWDLFKMDYDCIQRLLDELAYMRALCDALKHELDMERDPVKTIYH